MRINRIGNWAKTTILASLLATSPIAAKAQALNKGETVLARDTLTKMNSHVMEALLIDCDGNYNNFEKFALNTKNKYSKNLRNNKKGYLEYRATQYVDTLIRVFTKYGSDSKEIEEYYVAGPRLQSKILKERETEQILNNPKIEQIEHFRMEISEKIYNEIADFLKNIQKKEEHVVKPEKTTNNSSNYHPIKDIIDNMD